MNWKWNLADLEHVKKNGLNVFSCFSCGGGSTMGYKLVGYNVIGNCEIDKEMNALYVKNHHPKYNYQMDIRKFRALADSEIPVDLFNLDILDGSPPCSSFSLAGVRENGWGREKAFREGQVSQRLDDLFFEFIKVAKRLQPKVIVAENVKGIAAGNAKGYLNEIIKQLKQIGYTPQIFLLNSAFMGVPQRRERVFVIASRTEFKFPKLKLSFNESPISYGEIKTNTGKALNKNSKTYWYWTQRIKSDRNIGDIAKRIYGKEKGFTNAILHEELVATTITANGSFLQYSNPCYLSDNDIINIQTFPQDYNFMGQNVQYVCGMSVPPVMMAKIAEQINKRWFVK